MMITVHFAFILMLVACIIVLFAGTLRLQSLVKRLEFEAKRKSIDQVVAEAIKTTDEFMSGIMNLTGTKVGAADTATGVSMGMASEANKIIDCATCGCMVKKEHAVEGESRIKREYNNRIIGWTEVPLRVVLDPAETMSIRKVIDTPWHCKRCAPSMNNPTQISPIEQEAKVGRTPTVAETVASALQTLSHHMSIDPELAWSWHCTIAMAAQEEGAGHGRSERIARRFMKQAFDVETRRPMRPTAKTKDGDKIHGS